MGELSKSKLCCAIEIYGLAAFSFLLTLLFGQFTYAEQQITQFGITWTFDRNHTVGQFANGDYWILGPVTVIGIDPPSIETDGRTINGSMVNPSPKLGTRQGYDSTMYGGYGPYFDPNLNIARPYGRDLSKFNPLILQPHSSLVSTVSIDEPEHRPQIETAAILTVLDAPVLQGSFRPAYCDSDKAIRFSKNQLDYSLLASLKPTPGVPGLVTVARHFERPWLDHVPGWVGRYIHPEENMPDYGREMATQIGDGALMLHINFTSGNKETLLIRYVQLGIDLYGIVQDGGENNWHNDGGHASGRKWPILFAGLLLNDAEMINIGEKSGDYLYSDGYGPNNEPPDYIHFGEDDQTFYVGDGDIYEPPYKKYTWHGGFVYYGHGNGSQLRDYLEYFEHHRGMPDWGIVHATNPNWDGLNWDAPYRQSCTANSWAGFVLAAHIMGVKERWNHNALFDYMDRYMKVQEEVVGAGHWTRQQSKFIENMWDAYRPEYGPVWTMFPTLNITALNGTVTKNPDKAAHVLGGEVILRAVADVGYEFAGWSGDLSCDENPTRIIMHANRYITANFALKK